MIKENPGRFSSLGEVAADLDASRTAVRGWLEDAGVPAYQLGTGKNSKVRYARADIEDWLESAAEQFEEDEDDDDNDRGELDHDESEDESDSDDESGDEDDESDSDDSDESESDSDEDESDSDEDDEAEQC